MEAGGIIAVLGPKPLAPPYIPCYNEALPICQEEVYELNRITTSLAALCAALIFTGCAASPAPETDSAQSAPDSSQTTGTTVQQPEDAVSSAEEHPDQTKEVAPAPENGAQLPAPESGGQTSASSSTPTDSRPQTAEAFFQNTLFVGDSIMEGIRQYVMSQREETSCLGDAKFLTTTIGISLADLVGDRQAGIFYSYKGQETALEDIVTDLCPDRIFLLLGLNDLSVIEENPQVSQVVDRYRRLAENLTACLPETQIVIITNPPKIASAWLPDYAVNRSFSNQLIDDFSASLMEMCQSEGIACIDAHTLLQDTSGALPEDYCRDGYVHLNNAGSAVVVDALYQFAQEQLA